MKRIEFEYGTGTMSAMLPDKDVYKRQGVDSAVAVVVAEFEKRSVTFTVNFNTDMEIDGFWMK